MHYLLALLLIGSPVLATPTQSAVEDLTGAELCALIDLELWDAVRLKIIKTADAEAISTRCWAIHT